MNPLHRSCLATVGKAAAAAIGIAIASSPAAQSWPSLYADTPTGLVVEPGSVSQVPGLQGVVGAWIGSLERAEAGFICSGLTIPLGTTEAAANLASP